MNCTKSVKETIMLLPPLPPDRLQKVTIDFRADDSSKDGANKIQNPGWEKPTTFIGVLTAIVFILICLFIFFYVLIIENPDNIRIVMGTLAIGIIGIVTVLISRNITMTAPSIGIFKLSILSLIPISGLLMSVYLAVGIFTGNILDLSLQWADKSATMTMPANADDVDKTTEEN